MSHDPDTAWVPVDACTLPTAEQPLRVAEFDALLAGSLVDVDRPGPEHLRLHLADGPGVLATARDLAARETACCAFFDLAVARAGGRVVVDARVPASRIAVLDGLERRARRGG